MKPKYNIGKWVITLDHILGSLLLLAIGMVVIGSIQIFLFFFWVNSGNYWLNHPQMVTELKTEICEQMK